MYRDVAVAKGKFLHISEEDDMPLTAETVIDGSGKYLIPGFIDIHIEKWQEDDLITPAIAPHAPYPNDSMHLQKAS